MATFIVDDAIEEPLPRGIDLPCEDGEPLETPWHRIAMTLLIQMLEDYPQGPDHYIGGNMFVYFDPEQDKKRNFRGPDFFVVKGVHDDRERNSWVVWEENYLTPDYVIELASQSTKSFDIGGKKDIYEQELKTPEYVVFDYRTEELLGWRLDESGGYQHLKLSKQSRLWSEQLNLWLGVDDCQSADDRTVRALRFFDSEGRGLPTRAERIAAQAERADAESARANAEAERANVAEVEIARLKAELAKKA